MKISLSLPVCHHRDHRDLCVGRVPQILAEAQAGLHPGLLRLLLHPGIPHDHRGTDATHAYLSALRRPGTGESEGETLAGAGFTRFICNLLVRVSVKAAVA